MSCFVSFIRVCQLQLSSKYFKTFILDIRNSSHILFMRKGDFVVVVGVVVVVVVVSLVLEIE